MRLLVNREHSRLELYRKLQTRFADSTEIDMVLNNLQERGYLSDERFVEAYIEMRKRKGYGPLRIQAELRERGIGLDLISRYLEEADSDFEWYRLMQGVAAAKFGISPDFGHKTQQKAARFLEYRGFPTSMIRRYLWDEE